jgi:hypothetical protein
MLRMMMSRSSPCTFSRFFTNSPQNWSSSSRAISASSRAEKSASLLRKFLQRRFDLRLLRLGEGDYADAAAGSRASGSSRTSLAM